MTKLVKVEQLKNLHDSCIQRRIALFTFYLRSFIPIPLCFKLAGFPLGFSMIRNRISAYSCAAFLQRVGELSSIKVFARRAS